MAEAQLLTGVDVPPEHYVGPYSAMDEVPYGGVVTAVCDPPDALAPVNRAVRCVFDHTDDLYRLLGDSLECAGACLLFFVCTILRFSCGKKLLKFISCPMSGSAHVNRTLKTVE